jgi:hypothetical protein
MPKNQGFLNSSYYEADKSAAIKRAIVQNMPLKAVCDDKTYKAIIKEKKDAARKVLFGEPKSRSKKK